MKEGTEHVNLCYRGDYDNCNAQDSASRVISAHIW